MKSARSTIVLGSRSPRRRELLSQILPTDQIEVLPPQSSDEISFAGRNTLPEIHEQLQRIARDKCEDVLGQLHQQQRKNIAAILTADTVIVVSNSSGNPIVLGQPPDDDTWPETVRHWFREYYFGRSHIAATAVCLADWEGLRIERVVESLVTFREDGDKWLDWYLSTEEPRGKAGGYAIQEAGSIFVSRIEGSLSNIVGLPLEAVLEMFNELEIDAR